MKPYLNKGIFKELKASKAFEAVKVSYGSIEWKGGQDLCPDTLYEESSPIKARSSFSASEAGKPYRVGGKPGKRLKAKHKT
jgi:hypothetical protein